MITEQTALIKKLLTNDHENFTRAPANYIEPRPRYRYTTDKVASHSKTMYNIYARQSYTNAIGMNGTTYMMVVQVEGVRMLNTD